MNSAIGWRPSVKGLSGFSDFEDDWGDDYGWGGDYVGWDSGADYGGDYGGDFSDSWMGDTGSDWGGGFDPGVDFGGGFDPGTDFTDDAGSAGDFSDSWMGENANFDPGVDFGGFDPGDYVDETAGSEPVTGGSGTVDDSTGESGTANLELPPSYWGKSVNDMPDAEEPVAKDPPQSKPRTGGGGGGMSMGLPKAPEPKKNEPAPTDALKLITDIFKNLAQKQISNLVQNSTKGPPTGYTTSLDGKQVPYWGTPAKPYTINPATGGAVALPSASPKWLLPAAIIGGVGLLALVVVMMSKRE